MKLSGILTLLVILFPLSDCLCPLTHYCRPCEKGSNLVWKRVKVCDIYHGCKYVFQQKCIKFRKVTIFTTEPPTESTTAAPTQVRFFHRKVITNKTWIIVIAAPSARSIRRNLHYDCEPRVYALCSGDYSYFYVFPVGMFFCWCSKHVLFVHNTRVLIAY